MVGVVATLPTPSAVQRRQPSSVGSLACASLSEGQLSPPGGNAGPGSWVGLALFHSYNYPLSSNKPHGLVSPAMSQRQSQQVWEVKDAQEYKGGRPRALPKECCGLGTQLERSRRLVLGGVLLSLYPLLVCPPYPPEQSQATPRLPSVMHLLSQQPFCTVLGTPVPPPPSLNLCSLPHFLLSSPRWRPAREPPWETSSTVRAPQPRAQHARKDTRVPWPQAGTLTCHCQWTETRWTSASYHLPGPSSSSLSFPEVPRTCLHPRRDCYSGSQTWRAGRVLR